MEINDDVVVVVVVVVVAYLEPDLEEREARNGEQGTRNGKRGARSEEGKRGTANRGGESQNVKSRNL